MALAAGGLSGLLALYGGSESFLKLGGALSIAYVAGLAVAMVLLPPWRLGLFLALWLGAPPFLDYELAWTATAGFRSAGVTGLRADITYPIATLLDLSLVLGLILALASRRRKAAAGPLRPAVGAVGPKPRERAIGPVLFAAGVLGFTALGVAAAWNAFGAFPHLTATATAGLSATLRTALAALAALALAGGDPGRRETAYGLVAGLWLFILEGAYVTYLKNGTLRPGWVEMTGLIPGPGATGSLLVLIIPIVVAYALAAPEKRLRRLLGVTAAVGLVYGFLTYARTVYLGFAVAGGALLLVTRGRGDRRAWGVGLAVALVLALAVGGAVALASDYHAAKLSGYGLDLSAGWNLGVRLTYWSFALACIQANPLLGIGPQMWGVVTTGMDVTAHNTYLQYAVENGLGAFAIWAAVIGGSVLAAWAAARRATRGRASLAASRVAATPPAGWAGPFLTGGTAGVLGFLVTQLLDGSLAHYRTGVIFWTVLATLVVISSSSFTASRRDPVASSR